MGNKVQKQSFADVPKHRRSPTCELESLFDKVKERLQHRCFSVKFAKFLKATLFTEDLRWLLLKVFHKNEIYKKIIYDK